MKKLFKNLFLMLFLSLSAHSIPPKALQSYEEGAASAEWESSEGVVAARSADGLSDDMDGVDFFANLPAEIIAMIFNFAPIEDQIHLASTSRYLWSHFQSDFVVKRFSGEIEAIEAYTRLGGRPNYPLHQIQLIDAEESLADCAPDLKSRIWKNLETFSRAFSSVEVLDLFHSEFLPEEAPDLSKIFSCFSNLKELHMSIKYNLSSGWDGLPEIIAKIPTLERLYLSNNSEKEDPAQEGPVEERVLQLTSERAEPLSQALKKMVNLKQFHLTNVQMGDEAFDVLSSAFSEMPGLEELDVSGNALETLSEETLANLGKLSSLNRLDISYNSLSLSSAKRLILSLRGLEHLSEVDMTENSLDVLSASIQEYIGEHSTIPNSMGEKITMVE